MKLGLLKISNNQIQTAQYFESKFERELGEEINYCGEKFIVAVIAETRNEVIDFLNQVIKEQNRKIRQQNKKIENESKKWFMDILLDSINYVKNI